MHSRAIQCKQAACTAILRKLGKGHQRNMCAYLTGIPCLSCSAWAENMAKAWLPYANIWENFKGLILRCESKFFQVKSLVLIHSVCPCKSYVPKCFQTPHKLDYYLFNYRILMKEGPWAVHLTLGKDWGMGRYSRYQYRVEEPTPTVIHGNF